MRVTDLYEIFMGGGFESPSELREVVEYGIKNGDSVFLQRYISCPDELKNTSDWKFFTEKYLSRGIVLKESLFHPLWKQPIDYLNYMLENAEFIPVVVDKRQDMQDWVTISDWDYQNWVIGKNIIESKNPDVMREYSRLKEAGFGVNPKGKYFIFPKGNRKHHRDGMDVYFKRIKEQKGETSRTPVEEYMDRIVRY